MPIIIKNASQAYVQDLHEFLKAAKLPTSDLPTDLSGFTLAFDGEKIVGSAGMELLGNIGLLRSVAVAETHRNQNLGQRLFTAAIDYARLHDVQEVFLITESADRYFEKNGFQRVDRGDVPIEILETKQFSTLCPSSALVMKMDLETFTKPSRFSKRR